MHDHLNSMKFRKQLQRKWKVGQISGKQYKHKHMGTKSERTKCYAKDLQQYKSTLGRCISNNKKRKERA